MNEVVIVSEGEEGAKEESDEEQIEIKEFNVLIKKIERYAVDSQISFDVDDDITDLFDITVISKKRKFKCVLDPKLNQRVHRRLVDVNSMIRITDYSAECDESKYRNVDFLLIKDFEVLEFQNTNKFSVNKVAYRLRKLKKKHLPIVSSRMYYLPSYNDVDYYGDAWRLVPLPRTKLSSQKQGSVKTIQALQSMSHGAYLDKVTHGTVVTKSRLRHFAKADDPRSKYPFTFSVEIEHEGWTCSVSFWNYACITYFPNVKVGDYILLENYRIKKRYGKRTNTVYFGEETNVELSVNSCNPKGLIELLEDESSSIPYKFIEFEELREYALPKDSIIDVVGIVMFVGRVEREKNIKSNGLNCQDYWMYRWVTLRNGKKKDLNIKLYACSQPDVMNRLEVGDAFVGCRMLYKSILFCEENGPELHYCVTSSRETQLYRFDKGWTVIDLDVLPFKRCKEFLNILKITKDADTHKEISRNNRTGGYFVYPPLPKSFDAFQRLFNDDNPMEICTSEKFVQLTNSLHAYQTVCGVCLQATISAVEIIDPRRKRSMTVTGETSSKRRKTRSSTAAGKSAETNNAETTTLVNRPFHVKVLDEKSVLKSDDMTCIGDANLTGEKVVQFLGSPPNKRKFLRFLLTSLNNQLSILASFLPNVVEHVVEILPNFLQILQGFPASFDVLDKANRFFDLVDELKEKQRFLFVMDLHYYGNEVLEVTVNRAYQI